MVPLKAIFDIRYGSHGYDNKSTLDEGSTLLVASQGVDNGAFGFFDIPCRFKSPIITVPRTGSIGYAFVQLHACNVTDDCLILIPLQQVSVDYLFYVASVVRLSRWRYNYGRKITPARLERLEIVHPQDYNANLFYDKLFAALYPKADAVAGKTTSMSVKSWKTFKFSDIFRIKKGKRLIENNRTSGTTPYVGATEADNGITDFIGQDPIHEAGTISVTYNGSVGEAFYQTKPFWASDDVNVLYPIDFKLNALRAMFLIALIRQEKFRFSYGRKWHLERMNHSTIRLPVGGDDKPDWDFVEKFVKRLPYSSSLGPEGSKSLPFP
jgi:hypothetical protein